MKTAQALNVAPLSFATLRPVASLIGLFLLAMVVLSGTASLATAQVAAGAPAATITPATLDIPASADEPMAAFGQ